MSFLCYSMFFAHLFAACLMCLFFCLLIDFRVTREREKEGKSSLCCSTYLCIHWLLLICALTRDQTHNLGLGGRCTSPAVSNLFCTWNLFTRRWGVWHGSGGELGCAAQVSFLLTHCGRDAEETGGRAQGSFTCSPVCNSLRFHGWGSKPLL